MSKDDGIKALLARASRVAECRAARAAWVREASAAWHEAQRAMDRKCDEAVNRLGAKAFERLLDEEQAEVEALNAPLMLAARDDRWPRHLYLSGM